MAAPTAAQVIAALTIQNNFEILKLTAPYNTGQFNDATNYAALDLVTANGDTVKIVTQVLDPVGGTCYENAGFATDVFSAPDLSLTDSSAPSFTLNTYSGTNTPIYGAYTFTWKAEVLYHGNPAYVVEKTFTIYLLQSLIPTLSLEETPNCATAVYVSKDTSTYSSPTGFTLQTIVRTHKVRPPLISLKSDGVTPQTTVTADVQTLTLASTDNPLWTGAYSASLSVVLTYVDANGNIVVVKVPVIEADVIVECDNNYCVMQCCLNSLIAKYNTYKGVNTKEATDWFTRWQKGTMWYFATQQANLCSNAPLAASYIAQFYLDTGCDPDCDCGCSDEPSPVVPTTIINGTNGAPGAPGATGATGAAGAAGANGADGANGVAVLHNNGASTFVTTTNALQLLTSFNMTAGQMSATGDILHVRARFRANADNAILKSGYIYLDGAVVAETLFWIGSNVTSFELDVFITRTAATTGVAEYIIQRNSDISTTISSSERLISDMANVAVAAWANALTVAVYANDNSGNAITCDLFQATYYKKS